MEILLGIVIGIISSLCGAKCPDVHVKRHIRGNKIIKAHTRRWP